MRREPPLRPGRLPFIDGLRGVAAFVVMTGHAVALVVPPLPPTVDVFHSSAEHLLLWPFRFGQQMVWLFILLSGFALQWSEDERVVRGFGRTPPRVYAARRMWRILPTYYAALAVGLTVVVLLRGTVADPLPQVHTYRLTTGGVLAHVALVHNLSDGWLFQTNVPLWSIALEAQLYVLFPLLSTGVGRRLPLPVAAGVLVVGAVTLDHVTRLPLFGLATWFFAGSVLARLVRRRRLPWRSLLGVAAGCILTGLTLLHVIPGRVMTALWMLGFACLVAALTEAPVRGWNFPTYRPVMWLGHRSYSLYAVHFPVLLLIWAALSRGDLSRAPAVIAMLAVGVPASVAAAHALHLLVERPSLAVVRGQKPRRQVEAADGRRLDPSAHR